MDCFYLKVLVNQHVVYKLCHFQSSSCSEQSILPFSRGLFIGLKRWESVSAPVSTYSLCMRMYMSVCVYLFQLNLHYFGLIILKSASQLCPKSCMCRLAVELFLLHVLVKRFPSTEELLADLRLADILQNALISSTVVCKPFFVGTS